MHCSYCNAFKNITYISLFLQDAEHIYYRNPDLLSLRSALITHLRNNTQAPVHAEFSNCLDISWQNFLEENYPYFLIIADEGLDELQTDFLHICIIHTLSKRINIVLTSGQESDAIRIYGYHIHSVYHQCHFFQQVNSNIEEFPYSKQKKNRPYYHFKINIRFNQLL